MGERDERTGLGRERANAAYVAARANRDVWPRNEKTGCVVMGDERTGAELLREAARLMRSRAELATPAPWTAGKYHDNHAVMAGEAADCWVASTGVFETRTRPLGGRGDAGHIASWNPAVALAVADWLDGCAARADITSRKRLELDQEERDWYDPAVNVAKAYLSAPVSAGEPTDEVRDEQ